MILGDAKINIANFHLGRTRMGGRAIAFVNVDQNVPDEVMAKLAGLEGVLEAKLVEY
jgi:D-3-phosphoglycerate dehydrogenase / 2-oxoglutarate reductase